MSLAKEQLRDLLVRRGLVETRAQAERFILAGQVRVNGERLTQAGALTTCDAPVELLRGKPYVSRGGLKLEGALKDFSFDVGDQCCIDVGASSGGFTDCLLKAGAQSVTAVDVGYGQFDWGLRNDSRVTLFERTPIAKADPEALGAPFDLLVADLSFTSLARLAPELAQLLREQGSAITLVKPQFELPKALVKRGVVRSLDLHVQALEMVLQAYQNQGLVAQALSFSCLPGPKGNIEFWIWAAKDGARATIDTEETVRLAHEALSV
ncbi:MAG: TlyA family RNA methyltransferase [Coriobacteriales bacterium]|jgi:23S rRNA (cytidine1920-2'-O)/16S rRNA (cytidine1409-2'-O)-methyltransferase|nr:TlyA family RNA methyltransferase [Coriobacteriales bacterium]